MSYCVHCGVELGADENRCPLCGTPVMDPSDPGDDHYAKAFFPTRPAQVAPVSKRGMALLLTSMLVSVSLCCGLLNLVLKPELGWSLYVMGAAMMLWVWTVFPLLLPMLPLWVKLTADVGAIGLYVWIIALTVEGEAWFMGLAVPILLFTALHVTILCIIFRKHRSMLSTVTIILAFIGLSCGAVELCGDWYFHHAVSLGWSLIVLACCFGVCIPLIVVRRVPSLREEARRRFHL